MKNVILLLLVLTLTGKSLPEDKKIPLDKQGFIPVWNVAGPFDQPMFGFGEPVDKDMIGELNIRPYAGKTEQNALTVTGEAKWFPQSISENGFLDFNESIRWAMPDKGPEKIWYAITGYASAVIYSETDQDVVIKYGSNSFGKIFINNKEVFVEKNSRPAVLDENDIKISLTKGENIILVKAGNSHRNHGLDFFGTNKWEWGFYFRLVYPDGQSVNNLSLLLPSSARGQSFDIISTFFFKKESDKLLQRFDLELFSSETSLVSAELNLSVDKTSYLFKFDSLSYGINRVSFFIPEIKSEVSAEAVLNLNGQKESREVKLYPHKHYQLHVMMLSHTDIGYTHPQPVVKEIHASAIDDVLKMCNEYPEFKWTIETLWQLEQYELTRPKDKLEQVIKLIKEGRIAVNPLYANPFTGWVGEEEMIRSLDKAKEYAEKYGLVYESAVYNDIPGQSWMLPQVLNNAGVHFLAEGLNELFNDYAFQRALPKAFIWEGSDGSRVITYRNESYGEARAYGLEKKGNLAVQQRMWERINKLTLQGYDYEMILLNSAFLDNSSVPVDEYLSMLEWNKEYEYPKFISSTSSEFGEKFSEMYGGNLPVIKGDWTSDWDSFGQGEPDKMKQQRWVQHNLLSAEKISALTSILNNDSFSYSGYIEGAYNSLLNFSGHGSGLEYGYGSPEDNLITMEYRQDYLTDAYLDTEELIMRGMHRLTKPQEAFDNEGVLVFNTLSWERTAPVEIQFPSHITQEYEVIDAVTGLKVPSFRNEHRLTFIAGELPSFGYKKFILRKSDKKNEPKAAGLLSVTSFIENQFYKINYNPESGGIIGITDKKTGIQLVDQKSEYGFNQPLLEKATGTYQKINSANIRTTVVDESPVRIILRIDRSGELFERTEYSLWNNIDRIDVEHEVNLEILDTTGTIEQYSLAFPFKVEGKEIRLELLGGYADPETDLIPGRSTDQFSIRRSAALFNDKQTVSWTSVDARVLQLRGDKENKTLISNLVNNFPAHWNRNESNEGKLKFRYSFSNQMKPLDSYTANLGWELSTPPLVKRSWYKNDPVEKSFIQLDNPNTALLNLTYEGEGYILRIMNMDSERNSSVGISSEILNGRRAYLTDYIWQKKTELKEENNTIKVTLKPNEIITIKLIKNK